ncbi:hypothetical protein R3P38DRAFT_3321708 [Favolaschia claudopus]|uniref:Uncharacterized protein n=1 Tax=Favolaschia claudopus TaxID=2862362 RepID=A0AAW0ARQ3_9AGAR
MINANGRWAWATGDGRGQQRGAWGVGSGRGQDDGLSSLQTFFASADSSLPTPAETHSSTTAASSPLFSSSGVDFSSEDFSSPRAHSSPPFLDDSDVATADLSQFELSKDETEQALGWQWRPSSTVWLDDGVSSEICDFPHGLPITSSTKVFHMERVTGLPSQLPTPREPTAFLVDVTAVTGLDPTMTVDAMLKDQDPHSWGGPTGSRAKVDAQLDGILFGRTEPQLTIDCRRGHPTCNGVFACESLAPEFVNVKRWELDPHSREQLVAAQLRTRELQDNTRTGQVLAYVKSLTPWICRAVDPATGQVCIGGRATLKKLLQPINGMHYILVCSNRDMFQCAAGHRSVRLPGHLEQDLLVKALTGQKIVEDEDQEDTCCKIYSARAGKKGRNRCPFNHVKDGCAFDAPIVHLPCKTNYLVFIPRENKYPDLARMCIIVPDSSAPHTHPVPPLCVRRFGLGATVAKVEKAASTKELLDGLTPSLYHPSLISRDTKQKLINDVKNEPENETLHQNQSIDTYIAKQRSRPDDQRYIWVCEHQGRRAIFGIKAGVLKYIHRVRTLDCDTTFKPVVGKIDIWEINGWLMAINQEVTLGRVWISNHDTLAFKFVWEELRALVKRLTNEPLTFAALHRGGKLLGKYQ